MRTFLLYVVIGIAVVAGILALAAYAPNITHAWFSFVGFTSVLAIVLARMYWSARKSAKVWLFLAVFMVIHSGGYVILLRQGADWSGLWYVLTMPIEVMIVIAAIKICLNVMPRKARL